jgi:hypothetical protein
MTHFSMYGPLLYEATHLQLQLTRVCGVLFLSVQPLSIIKPSTYSFNKLVHAASKLDGIVARLLPFKFLHSKI